ncbi:hypothetical protein [Planktotalea sp.]|uniref:hypothetical protein n=1 Tax=Planktotalea sp. TaxID=2029877 RepID=UPI00329695C1
MSIEDMDVDLRERIFLIGNISSRAASLQGYLERAFGLICNAEEPQVAMAAIRSMTSSAVQIRLTDSALKAQFPLDLYEDLHSDWRATRQILEKVFKVRNSLAHSVAVAQLEDDDEWTILSLSSSNDIGSDVVTEHLKRHQGKPENFEFGAFAWNLARDAETSIRNLISSLEENGRIEALRRAKELEEFRAKKPPINEGDIFF